MEKDSNKDKGKKLTWVAATGSVLIWLSSLVGNFIASDGFQRTVETVTQTVVREYLNAAKK